ncbi:MAG: AMP-binding protein [Erysipelotrichaceae bacterium]|nr:AMP-binding protein [Erysipelotrichaceae bacterium]
MSRLLKRINKNCINYPERIAFIDDERFITYRQLWEESGKVCSWLKRNGYGKEDICLIVLPKSASSMASLLGILRAGCAFCNIDSSNPAEKISFIRRQLHPKCEIDPETYKKIQSTEKPYKGYVEADPHDAAFIVYTSAAIGTPKGVLHEMGNLDFCLSLYPDLKEYEELHTCYTVSFDSVDSIQLAFNCMCIARTVHIVPDQLLSNIRGMHRYLLEHQITDVWLPASFVRLYKDPSPYLKEILMSRENADDIYYASGRPSLVNFYSTSESCFPLLVMHIDKKYKRTPAGVPVLKQLDLHLEDKDGKRIKDSGIGEICFRNFYVRGYIDHPEENEKVFRNGIIHTGDIARRAENGLYTLIGRLEDMSSINGDLFHPGEIESVCRKILDLSWCAIKGFDDEGVVALYYTDDFSIDEKEARHKLEAFLPQQLIPSYYIHIDEVPLTVEGKTARNALRLPETNNETAYEAPRSEFEKKLAKAMAEVLKTAKVGIKDDFFAHSGNSLKAMELLEKQNIEGLNIRHIFEGRTVQKISELYEKEIINSLSEKEKEEIGRKKRFPLDPITERKWSQENNGTHDFIFAYQLTPMIKIEKLKDALNEYIRNDSSFNLIIENDKGIPVQVYSDDTPSVKIEDLDDDQVTELQKTFIRPFGYKEPLIRIRLIKTRVFRFIFFQMSHILMDEYGFALFLKDLKTLYKGGSIRPSYYFAYLYDKDMTISKEKTDEAMQYYLRKLDLNNRMGNLTSDLTEKNGQGTAHSISFPLHKIEALVSRYDSTNSAFVHLTVCLAMEKYNGRASYLYTLQPNRSPKQNPAGIRKTAGVIGICSESRSAADLFKDMNEQHISIVRYSCYDKLVEDLSKDDPSPLLVIYEPEQDILALGREIMLENCCSNSKPKKPVTAVRVANEDEKIRITFQYDMKQLSKEHAEEFVTLIKNVGDALLEEKISI